MDYVLRTHHNHNNSSFGNIAAGQGFFVEMLHNPPTTGTSENITFNSMVKSDFEITIDGPLSPYKFDFEVDETTGFIQGQTAERFFIKFTFSSSLLGNNQGKSIIS